MSANCVHVNERCRRKEGRKKQGHKNNKAKQHSTLKAVTFPKKNELVAGTRTHMYLLEVTKQQTCMSELVTFLYLNAQITILSTN